MNYQIKITFEKNTQAIVIKFLKRLLSADKILEVEKQAKGGVIIIRDLNEVTANSIATQLKQMARLGVTVEVSRMKTKQPNGLYLVRLVSAGTNKLAVVKLIRELTGMGLKEAKAIVDELGIVAENIGKKESMRIGKLLEAAGAMVRIEEITSPEPQPDPEPEPQPDTEDFKTIYGNLTDESGKTLMKFNISLCEENIQKWLSLLDIFKKEVEK